MKITKRQLRRIIKEAESWTIGKSGDTFDPTMDRRLRDYSPLAVELASEAIQVVNYPQGAAIENEIHALLDGLPNIDDDKRWEIADEALSAAGIMLGVGPDAL